MMGDEEFKVGFSALERGKLYPIESIVETENSFYGKKPTRGCKVILIDDDIKISTYLPKKLTDSIKDSDITLINSAGATDNKYSVCYYGKLQNTVITQFVGRIHVPGQGRFEKLFNDVGKVMMKFTPEKRKADEDIEADNSKKAKEGE